MKKNMYYKVGEEVDYKRIVLEFDRYLKETELIYAKDIFAVMDNVKETWEGIKAGTFVWMDEK